MWRITRGCSATSVFLFLSAALARTNGSFTERCRGERKQPERENGVWHRQEQGHDSFSRACELPQYVDSDKVTDEFKHGVLTITLPKSNAADANGTLFWNKRLQLAELSLSDD